MNGIAAITSFHALIANEIASDGGRWIRSNQAGLNARYSGCVQREEINASHDRRKRARHPNPHAGDTNEIEEWKDNAGSDKRRQCDIRRHGEWKANHCRTQRVYR